MEGSEEKEGGKGKGKDYVRDTGYDKGTGVG